MLVAAIAGGMLFWDKQKEQQRLEELCGTWITDYVVEQETAQTILENNDFYPEEIALADLEEIYTRVPD